MHTLRTKPDVSPVNELSVVCGQYLMSFNFKSCLFYFGQPLLESPDNSSPVITRRATGKFPGKLCCYRFLCNFFFFVISASVNVIIDVVVMPPDRTIRLCPSLCPIYMTFFLVVILVEVLLYYFVDRCDTSCSNKKETFYVPMSYVDL